MRRGGDIYLASFIVYFLSFFVLPGHPSESLSSSLFPLEVRLAQGEDIPLGPLFLGNLYYQLDSLYTDMERSSRRYEIWSYIHTSFLCAFLYSHFPSSAREPVAYSKTVEVFISDENGVPTVVHEPRKLIFSMRWHGKVCVTP
ncbi:hypothetical protein Vadar_033347 [Vaccinium darrowii]|uniref:Uncharacterized protein n=1 Tax=Vaccinium darrowii TaxID=229202 RepID=A0ACB7Y548_9ERIC|nr:hypothetical protein Vadar_033347 [Vaccinium darrowii]